MSVLCSCLASLPRSMCFMTSCCRKEPWAHLLWKWYLPTFNCPVKALGLAQYDWSMTGETRQRWIIRTVFYKGGTKTEVFIFQFMALGIGEGCIGNIGLAARAVVVKINPAHFYCLSRVPKSSIQAPTLQRVWLKLTSDALLKAAVGFGHLGRVVLFTEQMTDCCSAAWIVLLWWCMTNSVASSGQRVLQRSKNSLKRSFIYRAFSVAFMIG